MMNNYEYGETSAADEVFAEIMREEFRNSLYNDLGRTMFYAVNTQYEPFIEEEKSLLSLEEMLTYMEDNMFEDELPELKLGYVKTSKQHKICGGEALYNFGKDSELIRGIVEW